MSKQIAIDWNKYMTSLAGKLGVDLDNISQTGIDIIKANSTPDNADYIVEQKQFDNGSWYRKYKSGWLEQGGFHPAGPVDGWINLLMPYANTNYTVLSYQQGTGGGDYILAREITRFQIHQNFNHFWYTCGQGA